MDEYAGKQSSTQATNTVSETERLLSKLGHGYKRAKAQQILRLLKDQEALNQRFKDCALAEDEDEESGKADVPLEPAHRGSETGAVEQGTYGPGHHSASEGKKLIPHSIDPSRCRTSMGFYNEAECSGSVDGNSDEVDDLQAETDAALMEERKAVLGPLVDSSSRLASQGGRRLFRLQLDENDTIMEDSSGIVQSARSSRPKTGIATSSTKGKQYRRPTQMDSRHRNNTNNNSNTTNTNSATANNKNHTVSTSVSKLEGPMTPRGSVRGFCDSNPSMPRDEYGCLVSTPRNSSFQPLTPRYNELNVSGCTPRREESTFGHTSRPGGDPVLYNRLQHDLALCLTPRKSETSLPLTPRNNDWSNIQTPRQNDWNTIQIPRQNDWNTIQTPRQNDWNTIQTPRQNELSMLSPRPKNPQRNAYGTYKTCQFTPREDGHTQNLSSPRVEELVSTMTPRSHPRKYAALRQVNGTSVPHEMKTVTIVEKTSNHEQPKAPKKYDHSISSKSHNNASLAERGLAIGVRMPTTPRSVITVDQSPMHAMQGVAENGEVVTPRRQKPDAHHNKSKNASSSIHRTGGHQNLSKLSERVQPISMMKLPPLEVTMNKPVIS